VNVTSRNVPTVMSLVFYRHKPLVFEASRFQPEPLGGWTQSRFELHCIACH
jgi:hypothetical protein